jgi:3D (Asp-Asp-Asp) domain-containing protein|tara:strand:- start:186 stop:578 length:393 start_codon:yes stop_codon:yes gene_type:complete
MELKVLLMGSLIVANLPFSIYACEDESRMLEVTATAYTSSVDETDSTPNISAWGDRLEPGMRVLAVSRDLLSMGLTHGTLVQVEGFSRDFIVLDKMNKRWKKKVDIYMGNDKQKALNWGKRKVNICWKYQ